MLLGTILMLSSSLGLVTNSAYAEISAFGWPPKLLTAHRRYIAAVETEEAAKKAFVATLHEYVDAQVKYVETQAAITRQKDAFEANRALAKQRHEALRDFDEKERILQQSLRIKKQKLDNTIEDVRQLNDEPYGLTALQRAKLQAKELLVKNTRQSIEGIKREIAALVVERNNALLAFDEKMQPSTTSEVRYADGFSAFQAVQRAAREMEAAEAAYGTAGKEGVEATLDLYTRLENTRPPFITRLRVRHDSKTIYDAEWKAGLSSEEGTAREQEIAKARLNRELQILALSKKRIEILEANRAAFRQLMNNARAEAQVFQRKISDTEIFELQAKIAIEVAVVAAEIAISGGALTVASQGASLSLQRAVRAYGGDVAKQLAKNRNTRQAISNIVSKLGSAASAKPFEDAISNAYEYYGIDGISNAFLSEASEWVLSEVSGEVIDSGFESGIKAAENIAATATVETFGATTANRVAKLAESSKSLAGWKLSLGAAATEITAKVGLNYLTAQRLEQLGLDKVAKQTIVHVAQSVWNRVHGDLLRERLRADHIQTRVNTLRLLAEGRKRIAFTLDVKTDDPLTRDDIQKKHNVEISFETSEKLPYKPEIDSLEGFDVVELEPAPKLGKNWWKAYAVIYENELSSKSSLPLTIRKSNQYSPYSAFDSDPSTWPILTDLEGPTWKGFEPGPDTTHMVRLRMRSGDPFCNEPDDVAAVDDGSIIAGIVAAAEPEDCSYWAFKNYGILAVKQFDTKLEAHWVKTFSYQDILDGLPEEASSDQGVKRMDFVEGHFFSASNASPRESEMFGFDPRELWQDAGSGIYNGTSKTLLRYSCETDDRTRARQVEAQLSAPVSVLISLIRGEEGNIQSPLPEISIVFGTGGRFNWQKLKTWTDDAGTHEIYGVRECGERHFPAGLESPTMIEGYHLDKKIDYQNMNVRELFDYVEKKSQVEMFDSSITDPARLMSLQRQILTSMINFDKRRYMFADNLADSENAIFNDFHLVQGRKPVLQQILQLETSLQSLESALPE